MSYSGGGILSPAEVEAFVYQDPDGPPTAPESKPAPEQQQPKETLNADRGSRISEQDLGRLLADARAEGIAEGERRARASVDETLAQERKRIADMVVAFQKEQTEYYCKVEVELVHFALAIAARILHREAQVDRMVVAGLVKVMIDKLQQGSRVIARVRPEEVGGWRHYFHDNPNVQIVEDPSLEAKDCVLETELGTTEMGLDAQLKEVEKGFADLLAQRPESK
jgi:flagellar assembly protein FliH